MPKFVLHKKGFFFNDEAFETFEEVRGSIVNTFDSLETAKAAKMSYDIASMQNLKDTNAITLFLESEDFSAICQQLEEFFKKEFGITVPDKYTFILPDHISKEQAKELLAIMDISFHDVVEYPDDVEIDLDDFKLDTDELTEF